MSRKLTVNGAETDIDRQIGVCLGFGMTHEDISEHLDIAKRTIAYHLEKNSLYLQKVIAECQTIRAKTLAVIQDKMDAKERVRQRSWSVLEKKLKKADGEVICSKCGDPADLPEEMDDSIALGYLREGLDRTDGKSMNRITMMGQVEHKHVHQVSQATLDAIDDVLRQQKRLPAAQIDSDETEDVQEAELVSVQ